MRPRAWKRVWTVRPYEFLLATGWPYVQEEALREVCTDKHLVNKPTYSLAPQNYGICVHAHKPRTILSMMKADKQKDHGSKNIQQAGFPDGHPL